MVCVEGVGKSQPSLMICVLQEGRHVPGGISVVDYVSEQTIESGAAAAGNFSRNLQRDQRLELEMVPSG